MCWASADGRQYKSQFFGSVVESVDTSDLKSVGHYGRASSSLATPTKQLNHSYTSLDLTLFTF